MRTFNEFARRSLVAAVLGCALVAAQAQQAATKPTAAASAPAPADYRLGAGDVIRITVYQNPDLSLEARVGESGMISYPLLGSIRLGGLSVGDAEKRIADGLRNGNFVKQPQVSILLAEVRGNQVSVLGQVNRPGRFPIEVAEMRLTDMLAVAGGVAVTGGELVTVVGVRDSKPYRIEVNLLDVFADGQRAKYDIRVQDGDVIWVDRAPVVYIYGETQKPGQLRLERDMTVLQALATGGGLTQRGTERGVRVHRRSRDGKIQIIQPTMDDVLVPGDVVYIRESIF
jgi:polysaccharide biosynthesis/export protein